MTITFPLPRASFSDRLRLQNLKLYLEPMQDTSYSGGGDVYTVDLAPSPWVGDGQVGILRPQQAAELQALFETLDGGLNSFYMGHILYRFPFSDPFGEVLNSHSNTIKINTLDANNKELTLKDAPPGFTFTAGSFFHFDYGSNPVHRAFHRLVNTVTANGSGVTPAIEVRPHIRPGAVVNTVVEFRDPCFEANVVPGTFGPGNAETLIVSGMTFQFRQKI